MKHTIDFKDLPTKIQIDVIKTLYSYSECHVEHAHGKLSVATSYCLKATYADDEWISDEFTRENLGIEFSGCDAWEKAWIGLERKHRKSWEKISLAERVKCISDHKEAIARQAQKDLDRIMGGAR